MGGSSPGDDEEDPDTGILLAEEFSGRVPLEELERALKGGETVASSPRPRRDRASRWMNEALQNSSTVVRKVDLDDADTLRAQVDELPRPTNSGSFRRAPGQRLADAPNAPTQKRMPTVVPDGPPASAEVRLEPSVTDERLGETTGSSRDPRPRASDPGWIAVQASLWGLFVSGVLGLTTLVVFFLLS